MAAPVLKLANTLTVLALIRINVAGMPNAIFIAAIPFGISLVRRAIEVRSTSFVATTRRIGIRRIFLSRRERYIWLQKVNDIRLHQGLIQRMLGCGNLVIESSGEADQMVLKYVPNVDRAYQTLMELVQNEEGRRPPQWP